MQSRFINVLLLTLIAILVLTAQLPGQVGAQTVSEEPRLITVNGTAEVRVVPDEVLITLGVETWDEDLDRAKRENDRRVRQIVALAKSHGVGEQHIQTDHISIEPRYRDSYEKRDFIGYFVRKTIVITLRDLSRFEDLLASVLQGGVTHVHGIQFRTTELRKYRDEARALAIQAAREKAVALAGELGQEIGQPRTIHEDQASWWSWYNSWWGARWGGGMTQNVIQEAGGVAMGEDGALAPGQITVNARVTASFELLN
jgi:uncharacterized protein YggE